ncbi:MAG: haloacid dehalogenase [Campylobacteraceae bacterium 4484_4]|nr:MAG: haloacid dehalogenase [Campylobacteraceae bacterium 4484_4]
MITIPHFKILELKHIVLDYNGTIAKDGRLLPAVRSLLPELAKKYALHVITADTFGSVEREMEDFDLEVKLLTSETHTREKAEFIEILGASKTAAIGNGNNDATMLATAALSIAILGEEGCSKEAMMAADLLCGSIVDALELFLYPKRLIATLRR